MFVGGETQQKHRLIKDIWDAGHLALFGLLSFSYFSSAKWANHSIIRPFLLTTFFCLTLGTAIEGVQIFIHRDFSYDDIINDLIGGYLGLLALVIFNSQLVFKIRSLAIILFIALTLTGLRDLEIHLFDEYQIRKDFPLLADFETNIEKSRWEYKLVNTDYSKQFVKSGQYSLHAEFLPGRYPNISLKHFKGNWSGYKTLNFSIYNPGSETLKFTAKIYDQQHIKNGRKYLDRFHQQLLIVPGWNEISISLEDMINAPQYRQMDIEKINGFSLFTDKLKHPVTLYIDDIHLS